VADDNTLLPLGILLLGVSAMAGFMAFRPWPMPDGSPIEPGAYAVEILQGNPPAASNPPDRQADISVIEGGIMALIIIWAAGKIAGIIAPFTGGGGAEPTAGAPGEEPPPGEGGGGTGTAPEPAPAPVPEPVPIPEPIPVP
jgi:hypothetical protein